MFFAVIWFNCLNAQNTPANASPITVDYDSLRTPSNTHDNDIAQKNTSFIYLGYILKIHNFNVFNDTFANLPWSYNGDETQVVLTDTGEVATIRMKKDSVCINDDPNNNLENSIIEIIPLHKSDSFKLYYNYPIELLELFPQKSYSDKEDGHFPVSSFSTRPTGWKGTSDYKQITPRSKRLYHIPKSEDFTYEKPGGAVFEEIKGRLHLKEKIVYDKIAHIYMNTLIYKNKSCMITPSGICFKVERYINGKYKSTNYLYIEYESYE